VDVDGPATATIQTWNNCGDNRCGFITDEDGYDELAWQKIDAINVVPKTSPGAQTNVGKGGTWKYMNSNHAWNL
jgi:hypothetical protein